MNTENTNVIVLITAINTLLLGQHKVLAFIAASY